MDRSRGNLSLKLDATNSEYLGLLVKNNIRFSETDMEMALRIYEKYEAEFNQKTTDAFRIAVDQ